MRRCQPRRKLSVKVVASEVNRGAPLARFESGRARLRLPVEVGAVVREALGHGWLVVVCRVVQRGVTLRAEPVVCGCVTCTQVGARAEESGHRCGVGCGVTWPGAMQGGGCARRWGQQQGPVTSSGSVRYGGASQRDQALLCQRCQLERMHIIVVVDAGLAEVELDIRIAPFAMVREGVGQQMPTR